MESVQPLPVNQIPPTPQGHWLVGNGPEASRNPLEFYESVWREHGDVVLLRALGGFKWYLVAHPEGAERILQTNQSNYRKAKMFKRALGLVTGNGLVTSEGEFWRRQRRLAQPAFHRQRLALLCERMTGAAERMLARWDETHARTRLPFDIAQEMTGLTVRIAADTLFSADISREEARFRDALNIALEHISYRMRYPFALPEFVPTGRNRRFLRARRALDEIVFKIIEARRRDTADRGDLLSMLMLARDEETGEAMDDRQVKDEVMTLLIAGHETTAAGLAWAWYLLARHEAARESLRAEVATVLGGRTPAVEDLQRLTYARMVFEETMRLYPPAWGQMRESIEEDEISGYRVEANKLVIVSQYLTHRHPSFWERPDDFLPERFTPEKAAARPRFAYYPFGGGARGCIGNHFAMMEAQLVIACVAQRFSPSPPENSSPALDATFALRPKDGLLMRIL